MNISNVDFKAIEQNDSNYFLNKGANLYNKGEYLGAIEYYEIAASMGNSHAISNLGYCYLYGRGIPKDEKKAVLYFNLAANKNDIDALYKLGTFYLSGIVVKKDTEIALYFLERAKAQVHNLSDFPSLCYTLACEYIKDTNQYEPYKIFDLLEEAKYGYEYEINEHGATYYQKNYEAVLKILEDSMFDEFRDQED